VNRLTVLMYHEILPRASWPAAGAQPVRNAQGTADVLPPPLYVWEEDFVAQMELLVRQGFAVVSIDQVLEFYAGRGDLPDRAVLLTFDDLWKGGMTTAYAVLKRLRLPAVAFLVRSWIFDTPQVTSPGSPVCLASGEWEPLGDVFAFANHTDRLHPRGAHGPTLVSTEEDLFVSDLLRCEEWTTVKGVFAYPFGAVGDGALAGLRRQGFPLAFTTEPGVNDRTTDRMRLKRNLVPRDLPLDEFAKICDQYTGSLAQGSAS
jgi:peptidoglycan/xylan/chitin deacetylase (PgdA/CDA1 family)